MIVAIFCIVDKWASGETDSDVHKTTANKPVTLKSSVTPGTPDSYNAANKFKISFVLHAMLHIIFVLMFM